MSAQFDKLRFERISVNQGLPNCAIEEAIEDHFGFLWFATCEGLFRYDGYQFKAYRHDVMDSTSLSNPYVQSLIEDREGNIWVGTANGLDLLDRRTGKFQRFKPFPADKETKIRNQVWKIFEDSRENLWVSSNRSMLRFDKTKKQFVKITPKENFNNTHFITAFLEDHQGIIWSGTSNGLLKLNVADADFQHLLPDPNANSLYNKRIDCLLEEKQGSFLLGTKGGLIRWHAQTKTFEKTFLPPELESLPVDYLLKDSQGNIWVSFDEKGMGVYDIRLQKFNYFVYEANQFNSLSNNKVFCILEDKFRNIWVGTANGVCKIKLDNSGFHLHQNDTGFDNNSNQIIRVLQDQAGTIWSKTPEGVFKIQKSELKGKKVEIIQDTAEYTVGSWFWEDPNGGIWTSVEHSGIYRLIAGQQNFKRVPLGDTLSQAVVYKMVADNADKNLVWLGTSVGLCKLNLTTYKRNWYIPTNDISDAASNKVAIFEQYGSDEIWLYYTYFNSLGRFDKKTEKFEQFRPGPEQQKILEGAVKDIVISADGNIWLATLFGLTNFNTKTKEFNIYNKRDGLAESELNTVLLDQKDQIWICGNRFLSRFDHKTRTFQNYLLSKEVKNFISKSKFLSEDGRIFLGSLNGVYTFHPDEITNNREVPNIVLTDFKVKDESYLMEKSFENTTDIILSHDENDVTFEFSGLHYINPEANEYRCKLEGYSEKWQDLGREHRAVYANLNHGNYNFRVIAANSDGVWNEQGLSIHLVITPAYWQTLWFKALIVLVLLSIAYALLKNRQHQLALKRQTELAEQSAEYKTRFLADISHEIRTPMNAIIGLSKLALDRKQDEKQSKFIGAIQQSSQNLLTIINDLLDHTKLEAGKFTFVKKPFDLKDTIMQLKDTIQHQAEEKQITFDINIGPEVPQKLRGDAIRLNQILTNLLGNSLKFTNEGRVWLSIHKINESAQSVELYFEIGDTGIGIPRDKMDSIFESFNQAENSSSNQREGTGLGLSIARQLVEKQGGQLTIESELEKGTKLYFNLAFEKSSVESKKAPHQNNHYSFDSLKVLVVEDTYFNQMLVVELLKKQIEGVEIDLAENGQIALDKLHEKSFDMILMDVKMPVMDGYEATRIIRKSENPKIRNIPILGVTASAIAEQLQKCQNAGMNDYITKPIDGEELIRKMYQLDQKQEDA
ncbi:MAG: hybrid sensor histidine kinase/response regulator [Saprospiraceae bacterium]|nr:MAG: hybrid sensor histidine kinase/response regulator [Saprospiraceae bacterium]